MIKAVIVEPEPRTRSFTPYFRNDKILEKEFGAPIVNGHFREYWNERIEKIFLSYAAVWSDVNEICAFLDRHSEAELYWITNDYLLNLNNDVAKILRKRTVKTVCSYPAPKRSRRDWMSWMTLNLNALIYKGLRPLGMAERPYSVIYYGMYRKDREAYFEKYFDSKIIVSTSPKNVGLFKSLGIKARYANPFHWHEKGSLLQRCLFSLYLEDTYSHNHYTYPANRFYEALGSGVVQLFDKSCAETFKIAGYNISDYIVSDRKSLKQALKDIGSNYNEHLDRQLRWRKKARAERRQVLQELKEIILN